jgi:tetratricopeptide (TPR) repeat protein
MRRTSLFAGALILTLGLALGFAANVAAQQQQAPPQPQLKYTMPEYNAYQAARAEANPQQRVKLLDDFVAKYPTSDLLVYAYRDYYLAYSQLRDFPKMATYADKMVALGDKVDVFGRLEALTARAQAYYLGQNLPTFQAPDQLQLAQTAATDGLKVLDKWQKPEQMNEEQFAQQKKGLAILFHSIHGIASMQLKDFKTAVTSFATVHKLDPKDALNVYRLGRAYLSMDPPRHMDGFWYLAQAIGLKVQGEQQIRNYLRAQMMRYQMPGCEALLDQAMNELLALATQSEELPANYVIPSSAELQKIRDDTGGAFFNDLKVGGDKAKKVFLAYCGAEFPEVGGKVIAVEPGNDSITLKLFLGATPEETEAGTVANMEVKVVGQPEAKRLAQVKDWVLRFSGTLVGYDPEPFMVHWNNCKVNPEDIPEEQASGKAPAKAAKRPPKRPPAR